MTYTPGQPFGHFRNFWKISVQIPPHFRPGFLSQKVVQMLHQFSVIKFLHLRITKRWSFLMLLCPTDWSLFREALCFQLICHQSYMYHVMSVFSCEYGHTLPQACLLPPRGRNLEIPVLELGNVLRTGKKLWDFQKFLVGGPTVGILGIKSPVNWSTCQ